MQRLMCLLVVLILGSAAGAAVSVCRWPRMLPPRRLVPGRGAIGSSPGTGVCFTFGSEFLRVCRRGSE